MNEKNRKKRTGALCLRLVVLVIALGVLGVSLYHLADYWAETQETRQFDENLAQQVVTVSVAAESTAPVGADTDDADIIDETTTTSSAPIAVDFAALQQTNPDVIAWLYSPNTPINYPVVQSADNQDYLHRRLDGSENAAGTIFLDCRCDGSFSGWESILYGHNMKNDTMFGTLTDYKSQSYYEAHPVMYLLTPEGCQRVVLVAGYVTEAPAEGWTIAQDQAERDSKLAEALASSTFTSGVTVEEGERLLTLSTCSYEYENARFVVVGVLRD